MFKESDLQMYNLFKTVIGKSKIELEGKAVYTASLGFKWFEDLESKIRQDIESSKEDKEIRDVEVKPL